MNLKALQALADSPAWQSVRDSYLKEKLDDLNDVTELFFPPKWNRDNLNREDINKFHGVNSGMSAIYFLDRQEKVAQEGVISNVLQRGIFRSGITARDLSRVAADFADQRAMLELDKNAALRDIEAQKGAANAALNQGIGGTFGEIEAGNTETELAQLGAGETPSGPLSSDQADQGVTNNPGGYVAPGNVSIQDFQNSLTPQLRAKLTEQDILNMEQFYTEGIPQSAVDGMIQTLTVMANAG